MSAASNGGPVRPGTAWSDPDEREAFFPAAGAIRATERVLTEDLQPDPIALSERGEEVIKRIEELTDFHERTNLIPKKIVLGRAAWRALRLFHLFNYCERPPEQFTFNGLLVTSLPSGSDPWRVDVRSAGVGE